MEMVSINFGQLIRIVGAVFEKEVMLFVVGNLKGPYFSS
jgi:hypothetical protein